MSKDSLSRNNMREEKQERIGATKYEIPPFVWKDSVEGAVRLFFCCPKLRRQNGKIKGSCMQALYLYRSVQQKQRGGA